MSDTIEQAQSGLEHAHHAAHHPEGEHEAPGHGPRNVAILIAVLAACLALSDMGEKSAQNSYLTHHISVSDTYGFLQAKNIRRTTYNASADIIASLPAQDDATRARIANLRDEAQRMNDDPKTNEGSKQLLAAAEAEKRERDEAFHTYHHFERSTGGLQIAIVLASVSVVTKMRALTYAAAILGFAAAGYAATVALGVG
jgi:hypothetical protein